MSQSEQLKEQAEQCRASGLLGKPGTLSRLFEFLLARTLAGEAPKETEIAVEVFGKTAGFDVSQDAVVRVYVHKLRRRLEQFGVRAGASGGRRLAIPKGEYRLVLEHACAEVTSPADQTGSPPARARRRGWLGLCIAVLAALAIGALLGAGFSVGGPAWDLRSIRQSAIWAPLLRDELPITIVIGDYYLLGETDPSSGHVRRLVREFFINSHADFLAYLELDPARMQRYRNLDLTYLPAASAFALQDIVPVLGNSKRVRVMLMSQLDAGALKSSHIVYIGYVSGLGMLGDHVFAASRVTPGGSFDELVDLKTNTTYLSTAMDGAAGGTPFRDYGYFSTFAGPSGNRIVIIAGTRDTGVTQMAEALARRPAVEEICARAGNAASFESLHEVSGVAKTGLQARLLFASAMQAERVWEAR